MPRLWRAPALLGRRRGRARTSPTSLVWHDTPDAALSADNVSLCQDGAGQGMWRLERLRPAAPLDWLPARAAPVLAEAVTVDTLGYRLPGQLTPVAAFEGRLRRLGLSCPYGELHIAVLEGTLRGVVQDQPACRLLLEGEVPAVEALALELGASLPVRVPRAGLAAQALALARGQPTAPRRHGAPVIRPGTSLDDALAGITAHLADVILHWAALVPGDPTPEPVHQMRVGVRRLRSALSVFRRAMVTEAGEAPWLDELSAGLRHLAMQLGAARDWDVFLTGTGAEIAQAFEGDRRVAALLAAAQRRRAAAYAALQAMFDARAWPNFEIALVMLPTRRPWALGSADEHDLAAPAKAYAERALDRRLRAVLSQGEHVTERSDHELHALRKQVKRLRYAAEFFARFFPEKPVRKYLARLEHLQAVLGVINDRAVEATLIDQLGGRTERAFAGGVVLGYGAGRAAGQLASLKPAWTKFARIAPFWD